MKLIEAKDENLEAMGEPNFKHSINLNTFYVSTLHKKMYNDSKSQKSFLKWFYNSINCKIEL